MTLPVAYPTEPLESIKAILGDDPLAHLENLRPDDLILIAAFIQTFNFVEFNLRRSVSSFAHAGLVQRKKRVMPSDLVEKRWPRSFGQFSEIFKWNVRGGHAANLIAGSVAKYASSGVR
ncbi:hypothetical protein ACTJLC_28640, partial [Paraburkholderia sp. 22099]|uniref:hypothetical protein n=1 Tax=Paraburkholderia sp. 22099 TaxID=3453875 RepID=UPI003F83E2A6